MRSHMVPLAELRPNNWYVNRAKLDSILDAWVNNEQKNLPPVLITRIDGELSIIDGHSRALAALLNGVEKIAAQFEELPVIEGSTDLYIHIHREGPDRGVERISDLVSRVIEPDEYERLWIGYCRNWLEKHE
ncbi:MAG: ParB N-terminal domain-containing protein [Candidatus Sabulitectum sp.]|nr:ParB N-terminal domain-containing protein [Candidatus Sabulitectum sp.]